MISGKRRRAVDAAIELVGTGGIRALTHRAVDARAGLPDGSTSNYFRTRAALLRGVVEQMVATEMPEVAGGAPPRNTQDLVDRFVALYEFLVGRSRVMTAARLALFVEAAHDPELRAALSAGRERFEPVVRAEFLAAGSSDPVLATQLLGACFEGLFLQEIGGHGRVDARRVIEAAIRAGM